MILGSRGPRGVAAHRAGGHRSHAKGCAPASTTGDDRICYVGSAVADRLPPVVPSGRVTGAVEGGGRRTGLRTGVPVVIGAGDRPCEVLGTGATSSRPMQL